MNILDSIQSILQFGIDLGDCTDKQCEEFIANLNWYINSNSSSQATCEENKVVIENFSGVPVLALQIVRNRTLQFIPLAEDDFFESFMSVLEFISTDDTVPVMEKTKEESKKRMKLKSNKPEKLKKKKPKVTIDDFEWI